MVPVISGMGTKATPWELDMEKWSCVGLMDVHGLNIYIYVKIGENQVFDLWRLIEMIIGWENRGIFRDIASGKLTVCY